MAKFTLNIETDDVQELREIVGNIAGGVTATAPVAAPVAQVDPQITDAVTQIAPEKPKAAPKATKAKAEATPAFAPVVEEVKVADPAPQTTSLTPPPAAPTATYEQVKEALIALMDVKSASAVQALLKDKFGVVAISQLPKEKLGEALDAMQIWVAEA
ncbi:hypothetical protein UFOVP6_39 [uncultured Caudovirales phage]|uniref:Uncharacterized protein n=1 Tax=uncultured Caudovirales phage TaxID=2100421 RepID=A0A6J5KGS6_9CAUD|nr:hypothetical protein UFOVP6_39 [uncultured Caudovirales phage]